MDKDNRLVPENNEPSQQSTNSRQNMYSPREGTSNPLPPFFASGFDSTPEEQSIIGQLANRTEQILSEVMLSNVIELINNDPTLSDVLYESIDRLETLESFSKPQSSHENIAGVETSTRESQERPAYLDFGPSTSQARPSVIQHTSEFTNRNLTHRPEEANMFRYCGTSSEFGGHVDHYCIPEFLRPTFTQTNPESASGIAEWQMSNVLISPSTSNTEFIHQQSLIVEQRRAPLQTVLDPNNAKPDEPLLETASAKSTTLRMSQLPSIASIFLQTTSPPSSWKPLLITSLPSGSKSSQTTSLLSTSKPPQTTSPPSTSKLFLHCQGVPDLKVTTPPLNSLKMQLLLQTTIKMGVGYYSYTSNVNYQLCEPLKNLLLSELPSNQPSPTSEDAQDSSSGSSPFLSSSSSLDKLSEEKPPTISDLVSDDSSAPDTLYRCALKLAMQKTHLYSRRIQWSRIFFVPTEFCLAVQTPAELALGVCVTYLRECDERWCKIRCHPESSICLHMYNCTCPQKRKLFGWCSHIHAATYCGRRRFFEDTLAFVPTTSGIMKIHHLRAKYKYMKLLKNWPDHLRARLRTLELQGTIKQLRSFTCVCPKYKRCKECTACCCNYKCKCIDYRRLKFPCEHIHYLAMCTRKDPSTVLANEFRHYDYQTDDSGDETDTKSLSVIEEHHQRSFCIKRRQIKQRSKNSWSVRSNRADFLEYRVTSARHYDKKPGEQSKCTQCSGRQAFNWSNCCVECAICPHDYKCTCDENKENKKLICKHIHAVIRLFVQKRAQRTEPDVLAQGTTYSSTESEDSGT